MTERGSIQSVDASNANASSKSAPVSPVASVCKVVGKLGIARHLSLTQDRTSSSDRDIHVNKDVHRSPRNKKKKKSSGFLSSITSPKRDRSCELCEESFGMFRYRYTCKNCERAVCHKCSCLVSPEKPWPVYADIEKTKRGDAAYRKTSRLCGDCEDAFLDANVFEGKRTRVLSASSVSVVSNDDADDADDDGSTSLTDTRIGDDLLLMSPLIATPQDRGSVMSKRRHGDFLKKLGVYRSPIEMSYAELRRDGQKYKIHQRNFFALQKSFKVLVRDASPKHLADALDKLMEKWYNIFRLHIDEIISEQRSRNTLAGDFGDIVRIINAPSRQEHKTPLHKQVKAGNALRVVLLVHRCAGLIDLSSLDKFGHTLLEDADRMANDSDTRSGRNGESRSDHALVRDFLRALTRRKWTARIEDFNALVWEISREIFLNRDIAENLRKSAKSGSFAVFKSTAGHVASRLLGLVPFAHVIDFRSCKGSRVLKSEKGENQVVPKVGLTALEKALRRSKDDGNRKSIVVWLLKHGADVSRVQSESLRSEAQQINREMFGGDTNERRADVVDVKRISTVYADSGKTKRGDVEMNRTKARRASLASNFDLQRKHWSDAFKTVPSVASFSSVTSMVDVSVVSDDVGSGSSPHSPLQSVRNEGQASKDTSSDVADTPIPSKEESSEGTTSRTPHVESKDRGYPREETFSTGATLKEAVSTTLESSKSEEKLDAEASRSTLTVSPALSKDSETHDKVDWEESDDTEDDDRLPPGLTISPIQTSATVTCLKSASTLEEKPREDLRSAEDSALKSRIRNEKNNTSLLSDRRVWYTAGALCLVAALIAYRTKNNVLVPV